MTFERLGKEVGMKIQVVALEEFGNHAEKNVCKIIDPAVIDNRHPAALSFADAQREHPFSL